MKRLSSSLTILVTVLIFTLVLGHMGADSAFAAKKRKTSQKEEYR